MGYWFCGCTHLCSCIVHIPHDVAPDFMISHDLTELAQIISGII